MTAIRTLGPQRACAARSSTLVVGLVPAPADVAVVLLTWRDHVALFRLDDGTGRPVGPWQGLTVSVPGGSEPVGAVVRELHDATGLTAGDLDELRSGAPVDGLEWPGAWRATPYLASTTRRRLRLGAEHACYRWVPWSRVPRFTPQVPWLAPATGALRTSAVPA
jgi:hypothetical protein